MEIRWNVYKWQRHQQTLAVKVKEKAEGSLDQLKAKLVVNGMHQVEIKDYSDSFDLLVKPVSIRLVLTVAITWDWKLMQIDITSSPMEDWKR